MKLPTQFIESLEPRIAPALLVNGGNLLGGTGNPTTGETSTGANTVTLVKVLTGQALVFYNNGVITGISVGKHTTLDITGDIAGDIVTNLDANGRLTDSDHNPLNGEDGGILNSYGIKGITTHPLADDKGSVGRIIAGGQVSNVNVAGEIAGIYAGNGIFRNSNVAQITTSGIDTNAVLAGTQDTYTLQQALSTPNGNANIKNVTVNTARQLEIFAGSGLGTDSGAGFQGSSITNVTIAKTLSAEGSNPVVFLHAGDGGEGNVGGGNGGSIVSFNDQGSTAYVKLQTGNGGFSSDGLGGKGGSLLASTIVSSSTRYDFIMGHGGKGDVGGVGGSIQTLKFTNNITGGRSLIATDDFNGDGLPDVVLLNTLTGEATVSLGTTTAINAGEADFTVALQNITQADGSKVQTPFLPAEGANPTSLVVTDLNGDGLPDFVVSYASTNTLGVYTNTGNGTFAPVQIDLHGLSPTRIVAGDFAGAGHSDIAIVSAGAVTTAQTGLASEVFLAVNDGQGHLTLSPTPSAVLPGIATDAAGTQAYDPTGATVVGANLFVGFKDGTISPLFFRNGAATVEPTISAFNNVPVNSLDATISDGSNLLVAYSKDVNANLEAAGNTTVTPMAQGALFAVDASGHSYSGTTFTPDASVTKVHFVADTSLIATVSPAALTVLSLDSSNQYAPFLNLGSDGQLADFAITHQNGTYQFAASGAATNRFFFTEGTPGSTAGVNAFESSETPFEPRAITFATGDGGDGVSHAGGTAGSIKGLTYTQTLGPGVLQAGGSYNTILSTGHGGDSVGDVGGKGGGIRIADLSLNPAYLSYSDDTTTATFDTGAGGQGTTGGDGGSIKKVSSTSVLTEIIANSVNLDSVAVSMKAGDGGVGTQAVGGKGGSITLAGQAALSGVTYVDEDAMNPDTPGLVVTAGNGGTGITAGGNGGSLTNVGSQNADLTGGDVVKANELSGALLSSGNGGDASNGNGGAGGSITGTNVTTSQALHAVNIGNLSYHPSFYKDGNGNYVGINGSVTAIAGDGGTGHGGVGGLGGSIDQSTVASSNGDQLRDFGGNLTTGNLYGVFVKSGKGGDGDTGGGAGGALQHLTINSPADPTVYAGVVAAGNGGDALSAGAGGAGGSIQGITQNKDVNSAINVIQAGNGGLGVGGAGGVGGSIKGIDTVGFIGLPSTSLVNLGAFHTLAGVSTQVSSLFASSQIPQGLFAGQGADGAANGSIENVVARQIAAIGASVQQNGHFAVAASVDDVTADLIGYQTDITQTVYRSQNGKGTSPSSDVPIDGFILAALVSNITTLNPSRTAAFTFSS